MSFRQMECSRKRSLVAHVFPISPPTERFRLFRSQKGQNGFLYFDTSDREQRNFPRKSNSFTISEQPVIDSKHASMSREMGV